MYKILTLGIYLLWYTSLLALGLNQTNQQYDKADPCQQIAVKIKKPLPCPKSEVIDLGGVRRIKVHHRRTTDVTTNNKEVHYIVTDWKKGEKQRNCYPCPKIAPLPSEDTWQGGSNNQGQAQQDSSCNWNMKTTPKVEEVVLKDKQIVIEDNRQEDTKTIVYENCIRTIKEWWDDEIEEELAPGCAQKLCHQLQQN